MEPRQHHALKRHGTALSLTPVPTPAPQEGEVLIALSHVGVCGTDLQILNGARPDSAEILGHEAAGVVAQAGPGATFRKRQRVVFNPSAQLTQGRILGHNVSGLFQQYYLVNAQGIEDGLIQTVAEDFPSLCGALVEPVAGIVYTHELVSQVLPECRSVVIFGAGPIGLIAARYFRAAGVRALVIHSSQPRLDTAHQLALLDPGSSMTLGSDLVPRILAWNGGRTLDAAVITTSMAGASSALAQAVEVVQDGGCIEMVTHFPAAAATPAGISAESLRAVRAANLCGVPAGGDYVFAQVAGRRLAFTSHRGTSRAHLNRAMQVLMTQTEDYRPLITHILTLPEAAGAVPKLAQSRAAAIGGRDCIKAVIDLTSSAEAPLH